MKRVSPWSPPGAMYYQASLASIASPTRGTKLVQNSPSLIVEATVTSKLVTKRPEQLGVRRKIRPLRAMRNCEWETSHILIFLALSAFLCHPATGRAGWGADVHLMNSMKSAVIRMLEQLNLKHPTWLRGKYSIYDFIGRSLNRQPLFYAAQNFSSVA